jgi:adenine-specific DNA-methyltransferase
MKEIINSMDGSSLNITQDLIQQLKAIVPGAFTEDKINVEQLKKLLGETVNTDSERYQLNWAGKSEAYKVLQSPSRATLLPQPEESINWDTAEHIFIEGENLEVLKVLQKSYYGKVKVVCIDPPYNTGSDSFIYPDKFSETKEEYLKRLGEKDEEGYMMKEGFFRPNRKESGQFHSNWLSMMLPRLFLARNLMKEEGFIFVSIDDNELSSLKLLMDEVFGSENFRNILLVRRYDKNINTQFMEDGLKTFNTGAEYVLIYSKSSSAKMNPVFREASEERKTTGYWKGFWNDAERKTMQYDLLGVDITNGQWKWKEDVAKEAVNNYKEFMKNHSSKMTLEEYWKKTGSNKKFIKRNPHGKGVNQGVEHWIAPSDKILRNTLWQDIFASKVPQGYEVLFNNPKNPEMLKLLIEIAVGEGDEEIVLDFFGGSGSTAHSVIEYNSEQSKNLKFITVQLPELIEKEDEAYKKGFRFISDITKKRIKDVLANGSAKKKGKIDFTGKEESLGFKCFKLSNSNFKIWRGDFIENENDLATQTNLFKQPLNENPKLFNIVWELIIKNGYSLSTPVKEIKADKTVYYSIADNKLVIVLEKVSDAILKSILKEKPKTILALDSLFTNDDCFKTNAILKLEQEGIEFHSI